MIGICLMFLGCTMIPLLLVDTLAPTFVYWVTPAFGFALYLIADIRKGKMIRRAQRIQSLHSGGQKI